MRARTLTKMMGLAGMLVLATGACSQADEPTEPDATVDATIDSAAVDPIATLPRMQDWPCPAGWQPEAVGERWGVEHAICVPPAQQACPEGQAQFLGEAACRRIGTTCPSEPFLPEPEIRSLAAGFEGRVLYVKPGAAAGSGSRSSPWGSYRTAYESAAAGDIIALGRGTLTEMVLVYKRLAIVGSCVEETTIEPPPPSGQAFVAVGLGADGAGALVTNLRVSGPRDGIWITQATDTTVPVSLRRVEVLRATGFGVTLIDGVRGELDEVVIRETGDDGLDSGQGLVVDVDAVVVARRLVIERNRGHGILVQPTASDQPADVSLTDVVVRDTATAANATMGIGLALAEGATVAVERGLFEHNHQAGVFAIGSTTLQMKDIVARQTAAVPLAGAQTAREVGLGLSVLDGSTVSVQRGIFDDNVWCGILASVSQPEGAAAELQLEAIAVRRTLATEPHSGNAITFDGGARVTLRRAYLEQSRSAGIRAIRRPEDQEPAVLSAEDLVVVDTKSDDEARLGRGIAIVNGASATIDRALLAANREVAVLSIADEGMPASHVELRDVTIHDTQPARCADLAGGDPLACSAGSTVAGGGTAISAAGGSVSVDRFDLHQNALCGLQISREGKIEASDGVVHGHPIGANVQVVDYDLDTIVNASVRYFDNDSNLESTDLPLPDPGPTSAWAQ